MDHETQTIATDERVDDIATTALDVLMDNHEVSVWADHQAESELGRKCQGEDDDEWFEHVGSAYDQLLGRMKALNSVDIIRDKVH